MKRKLKLKEYKWGNKTAFYTLIDIDENGKEAPDNLTNIFFKKYINSHQKTVNNIATKIEAMAEKHGANENYFRYEADRVGLRPNLRAFPPKKEEDGSNIDSLLRLYCLRLNNGVVVLGGGCFKPYYLVGKKISEYQDVPECEESANILEKVYNCLNESDHYNESLIYDHENILIEIEL